MKTVRSRRGTGGFSVLNTFSGRGCEGESDGFREIPEVELRAGICREKILVSRVHLATADLIRNVFSGGLCFSLVFDD
jgi:hypothetical protein